MTVTLDPELTLWWAALAALLVVAWCALATTGMTVARLALDLDKENKARRLAHAKNQQPTQAA